MRTHRHRLERSAGFDVEHHQCSSIAVGDPQSPVDRADRANWSTANGQRALHAAGSGVKDRDGAVTGVGDEDLGRAQRAPRRDADGMRSRAQLLRRTKCLCMRIERTDGVVGANDHQRARGGARRRPDHLIWSHADID